jgi:hypothetical protein
MDVSLAVQLTKADLDQQIATAHAFPRSIERAIKAITSLATNDPDTAADCRYALPRGKGKDRKVLTGPSIRFAELVLAMWGNNRADARVVHIDRKEKWLEAEGTYHDLENNSAVRARVRRRISTSSGGLFSDDMIIVTGNAACSIALRNAILRGIPRPVWGQAFAKVEGVIRGDVSTLAERREKLIKAFGELSVAPEKVYAMMGIRGRNDIDLDALVILSGFYTAIRNNEMTAEDFIAERTANMPQRQTPAGLQAGFGDEGKDAEPETGKAPAKTTARPKASAKPKADETPPHDPATGEVKDDAGAAAEAEAQRLAERDSIFQDGRDAFAAGTERAEVPANLSEEGAAVWFDGWDEAAAEDPGEEGAGAEASTEATETESGSGETETDEDEEETTAPAGEVYMLIGEGYTDGRRPTYRDGVPHSTVTEKGAAKLTAYDHHAPELESEATGEAEEQEESYGVHKFPPIKSEPAAESDAGPAEEAGQAEATGEAFDVYIAAVEAAETWPEVKAALQALAGTPDWTQSEDEGRRMARVAAYERYSDLAEAGGDTITLSADLQLFSCWLATGPAVDRVKPVWRDVIRTDAYKALPDAQKDQLGGAVAWAQGAMA